MSTINVIEFYSRLGVNPYMYIAIFVALIVVLLLVLGIFQSFFFRSVYTRAGSFDKDASAIFATLTEIDIQKKQRAKAVFIDEEGEIYIFALSKLEAAFLTAGDSGMLRFKGDKFVAFEPGIEEIINEE